jgi:ABC-2 type transport system ATP-binding protein
MDIIRAEQISKRFDGTFRLGPLDFRVAAGEIFGVAGTNSTGKTTLLKLLWGLMKPDQGHIAIFGMQPHLNQLRLRRFAGYLSQDPRCHSHCTATQFLRFVGHFYDGWEEKYACALLNDFDIDPEAKLHALSKGDRMKLGIVAAASHRPHLLLLDEPVSGVDAESCLQILDFLRTLAREKRASIVVSCMARGALDGIADSILMLPPFDSRV